MELIKTALPRKGWSEFLYVVINLIFPTTLFLLVLLFDHPYLAIALVFLSKWRVLAVQPRFWWANIRANMVDILVGLSTVALLYAADGSIFMQVIITAAYAGWLVLLKPRSNASAIALQAGIAQFVALTALFGFSNDIPDFLLLLAIWTIAYSAARHFISNFNEPMLETISACWAFLIAQLGWLLYHWTLVYEIDKSLQIPQLAVLVLVLSFTAARLYVAHKHGEENSGANRYTIVVGGALIVLVLLFAKWNVVI